ncbi:DUF3068 domain-containing protein [Rhodococcus olei]
MSISTRPSRRGTACAAIVAGTFLLTASALAPTYAAERLVKIPLSIEADTVSTGSAVLLDAAALAKGKLIIDHDVPVTINQLVTVQDPSDVDVVTLQSTVKMTRDDRTGPTAIVNASVDRSTVNRRTGLAVEEPAGSIQSSIDKPGDPVVHDGLQFKFPFDTQKWSYPYFDTTLRASHDVDFVGETELEGLPVYQFHQEIAPTLISGTITLPASTWGRAGAQPVTMKRFYGITRDLWVEPTSGAVVQVRQHYHQYFGTAVDDPNSVTIIDVAPKLDTQTQSEQVAFANKYRRLIQWGTVYGPIMGAVTGVLLLAGGIYLGVTGRRRETPVLQPEASTEPELVAVD